MQSAVEALAQVDRLLDEMIAQQRAKVLAIARQVLPSLSSEDVLNPDGYPELADHGPFNYEDGQLAGLISSQMAIRARLARRLTDPD
jgi:hypothetical protein